MPAVPSVLDPFAVYAAAASAAALLLAANGIANLWVFKKPRAVVIGDSALPSVSVLIPARNEQQSIESCVRSLLAQNYPNFEVVVLDDSSSDATYDILCKLRDQDHRLRVLVGAALPDGWCGKPFACWQLANVAKGDYLLFTDADCDFSPDALLMAVGGMAETGVDLVSLMPDYLAGSFSEGLLMPLLALIPFLFLPFRLVRGSKHPIFAAANGAFLFISRQTYLEIDGHRAVRDQLTEDIKFAAHVKRMGRSVWYGDGGRVYRVRMYSSPSEMWEGFSRIIFPAFSYKLGILVATLLFVGAVFVLPAVFSVEGFWLHRPWATLMLLPYMLIVAARVCIGLALRRGGVAEYAVLDPFAWLAAITLGARSAMRYRSGLGLSWKGREYRAQDCRK